MKGKPSAFSGIVALLLALSVVGALPAVAGLTAQSGTATAPVSISLDGPTTITAGDSTKIKVRISASKPVYGVEFTVRAKPQAVRFNDLTKGSYLSQDSSSIVVVNEISESRAKYGETRISTDSGVTGSGTVAILNITVLESITSDKVSLVLEEVLVARPDATALQTQRSNLTIAVNGGAQTRTQGATTTQQTVNTNGDSSGAQTSPGTVRESTTTVSAQPRWQAKVDSTVMEKLETNERVPVLIEINDTGDSADLLSKLNASGISNTRMANGERLITGKVSEENVQNIAQISAVKRVRYNPSSKTNISNSTTRTRANETPNEQTTPTATTTQPRTSQSPGTTQGSGPGFGLGIALVAIGLTISRVYR